MFLLLFRLPDVLLVIVRIKSLKSIVFFDFLWFLIAVLWLSFGFPLVSYTIPYGFLWFVDGFVCFPICSLLLLFFFL